MSDKLFGPAKLKNFKYIFLSIFSSIQSTLVISNSKGLTETLRDIRTLTYQS